MEKEEYLGVLAEVGLQLLLPIPNTVLQFEILLLRYKPKIHTVHEKVIEKGFFVLLLGESYNFPTNEVSTLRKGILI